MFSKGSCNFNVKAKTKFYELFFLFGDIIVVLPMIACHSENIENFVDKTGKREITKSAYCREFP